MEKNLFKSFDSILYNKKSPLTRIYVSDEAFVDMINRIVMVDPPFEPYYKINYKPPFNNKTRYYHMLINQYTNQALQDIYDLLTSDEIPDSRIERLYERIKEELYVRLDQSLKYINSISIAACVIDSENVKTWAQSNAVSNTYIFSYLRLSLILILDEMHTHFRDLVNNRLYTGGAMKSIPYVAFDWQNADATNATSELVSGCDAIMEVGAYVLTESITECDVARESEPCVEADDPDVFVPILDDFREPDKWIGAFNDMVRYPKRLGRVEIHLNKEGIIDNHYQFRGHHGHKKLLAAIYHLMIEKNLFKGVNDTWGKHIQPVDVRRFLDYRYGVKLGKQFQNSSLSVEERDELLDSFEWLTQLL